jgi:hypothetical protein
MCLVLKHESLNEGSDYIVRDLQCGATVAAKSSNCSRLIPGFAAKRLHSEGVPIAVSDPNTREYLSVVQP